MNASQKVGLREQAATAAASQAKAFLDELSPPIDVKLASCSTYSDLLRGNHEEPGTIDDLVLWAIKRGRVIISGRGASGKSAIIYRAALKAAELQFAPYIINLSRWDHAATEEWKKVRGTSRDALDFLLLRFSSSNQDVSDAEFLSPSIQKLFFLDGLNETPGTTADEILAACDEVASIMVGASFVVSDRIARRNLNAEHKWRFVMPLPVQQDEVKKLLSGKAVPAGSEGLLDSPFFLDRAIRGELRNSPLATIRELVENRGKLDATALAHASQAAYSAYEIDVSRTFSVARFVELGREDVLNTLLIGGILVRVDDELVAFAHHWYHDYLASKYVTDNPTLWSFENRHRALDILTFGANSFDAVAFALEMLPLDASGQFIQAVYDWNPYAAGYALAEASISVDDIPPGVRLVILAMLAERRFDRHYFSAIRAADALDLLDDKDAVEMRAASSLSELQRLIAKIDSPSKEFSSWRELFLVEVGSPAPNTLISAIENENSMMGWAAANVLKRLTLTVEQTQDIIDIARKDRPVIRWRAVHVMGGFIDSNFIAELLSHLDRDEDEYVRYGSLRSLIEIASRTEEYLPRIVDSLLERLDPLKSRPRLLGELKRAVFLSKDVAPETWVQQISRLFYELLDRADSAEEAEQWSGSASRLRIHFRPNPRVAA
jgi:hypothetical protein